MSKGQVLAGIDIGSSQVCCVLGKVNDGSGEIEIVSGAKVPSKGIKGGVVISIQETSYAIGKVIEMAEEQANETVQNICLGLRGSHIESMNAHGAINISRTDKEITQEDVYSAIETAKAVRLSQDREILSSIPQEYSLNHQRGVPNPVGMEGNFLEVDIHIVTASSSHINNIYKATSGAGFKDILNQMYGLVAVGNSVITQEEKELGCLLIDFGGLTTGIAIYSEGSIRFSKELQVGSDFITRDISHGLRTSMTSAQDIKEKYGIAMANLLDTDTKFDYKGVDGRTVRETSRRQLIEMIQPRLDQIFVMIDDEIRKSNYADAIIPGEVIITGGGAKLEGIIPAAEQALNCSARVGLPQDLRGNDKILGDTTYATAIGLLNEEINLNGGYVPNSVKGSTIIEGIKEWFERTF